MTRSLMGVVLAVGLMTATNAGAASPHYPQTAQLDGTPTAAEATVVRGILSRSFGAEWTNFEKTDHRISFAVGHADLNGDGRSDLLVLLNDPGFGYCGSGGCSAYAILATQNGYANKAIDLADFFEKAVVLPTVHKGMHDVRFDDGHKIFIWDGGQYR